jgi:hypothetical protein
VDLAVYCLDAEDLRQRDVQESYLKSDIDCWKAQQMMDAGLAEGDGVFVLGYPLGEMSPGLQRPIARAGIIGRIRDMYETPGRPYLIDAHIFEGNSGGPVITRPQFIALPGSKTVHQCMIIGIVTHVHGYWAKGRVLSPASPEVRVRDPAGLGTVQPVDRIFEAIAEHRRSRANPSVVAAKVIAPEE